MMNAGFFISCSHLAMIALPDFVWK